MSHFIQLHLLTFYGPSNLNRDDIGRPKTAVIGGIERLRISSQSLKRAVRTAAAFKQALDGHLAQRTQRLGSEIERQLIEGGTKADCARKAAREVAGIFGKIKGEKDEDPTFIEQLAFISPEEQTAAMGLARRLAKGEKVDLEKENPLRHRDSAADIAMFGRMLVINPTSIERRPSRWRTRSQLMPH